jgi:hypothetical protein
MGNGGGARPAVIRVANGRPVRLLRAAAPHTEVAGADSLGPGALAASLDDGSGDATVAVVADPTLGCEDPAAAGSG